MRDLADITRAGVGLGKALERVQGLYPKPIDSALRELAMFGEVSVRGPWILTFTFNVLGMLLHLGSSGRALDRLAEALTVVRDSMASMSYMARPIEALNYLVPVLFMGIVYVGYALHNIVTPPLGIIQPLALDPTQVALVAYSLSLSLSIASSIISNQTPRPTPRHAAPIPICVGLTIAASAQLGF